MASTATASKRQSRLRQTGSADDRRGGNDGYCGLQMAAVGLDVADTEMMAATDYGNNRCGIGGQGGTKAAQC